MSGPVDIEHDTLEEAPGSARGERRRPAASEAATRRDEMKDEAGRAGRPWCAFDNPEIWTVLAGDPDED